MLKRARSTSPPTDVETSRHRSNTGATDSVAVPDHIAWATCIKRHHQTIRDAVKTNFHGDADAAWASVVEDKAALKEYATCMHHLATQYWAASDDLPERAGDGEEPNDDAASQPRGGGVAAEKFRYDDRVQYALRCMQEYFFGPQQGSGGAIGAASSAAPQPTKTYLPFVATAALKVGKRAYYDEHKSPMPANQQFEWLVNFLRCRTDAHDASRPASSDSAPSVVPGCSCGRCCPVKQRVLRHLQNMYHVRKSVGNDDGRPSFAHVKVLDVGSCYGPLQGKTLHGFTARIQNGPDVATTGTGEFCPVLSEADALQKWCRVPQPLDVVSVDLCPYEGSGVLRCDWLSVPLRRDSLSDCHKAVEVVQDDTADASATLSVKSIAMNSFDVVHFSLVLSYLPSPEMRFRALARAHAVLKDDGLLIVISTRTQGPRQTGWVDAWVSAITTLGFTRVHKTVQCRLIGMTFQKIAAANDERESESSPPRTCDGNVLLWSNEERAAAAKLTITADAVL